MQAQSIRSKYAASECHEAATIEEFKDDPTMAADYLSAVVKDGNQQEIQLALARFEFAFGNKD